MTEGTSPFVGFHDLRLHFWKPWLHRLGLAKSAKIQKIELDLQQARAAVVPGWSAMDLGGCRDATVVGTLSENNHGPTTGRVKASWAQDRSGHVSLSHFCSFHLNALHSTSCGICSLKFAAMSIQRYFPFREFKRSLIPSLNFDLYYNLPEV